MDTTITVRGRNIDIQFKQHAIKLVNNGELAAVLANETEAATGELVVAVKEGFHKLFNRDFNVADASVAVEIWGHVYADKFADGVKSLSSFVLVDNLAEKISRHCEIINIGEPGHDNNRFIWDKLACFKSAIAGWLP